MKKLKRFTISSTFALSEAQMMDIFGGDTDPNVCHSKTTDDTCSGNCYQYVGGKEGYCNWDYKDHSCQCVVAQ